MLLADRHHGLRDSVRGFAAFVMVFMVANEASLLEGAAPPRRRSWSSTFRFLPATCAGCWCGCATARRDSKVLMLTVHDEPTIAEATLNAGADAVVLKRCLTTDLVPAITALRAGERYVSPGITK